MAMILFKFTMIMVMCRGDRSEAGGECGAYQKTETVLHAKMGLPLFTVPRPREFALVLRGPPIRWLHPTFHPESHVFISHN